jgi:hypothetical protein
VLLTVTAICLLGWAYFLVMIQPWQRLHQLYASRTWDMDRLKEVEGQLSSEGLLVGERDEVCYNRPKELWPATLDGLAHRYGKDYALFARVMLSCDGLVGKPPKLSGAFTLPEAQSNALKKRIGWNQPCALRSGEETELIVSRQPPVTVTLDAADEITLAFAVIQANSGFTGMRILQDGFMGVMADTFGAREVGLKHSDLNPDVSLGLFQLGTTTSIVQLKRQREALIKSEPDNDFLPLSPLKVIYRSPNDVAVDNAEATGGQLGVYNRARKDGEASKIIIVRTGEAYPHEIDSGEFPAEIMANETINHELFHYFFTRRSTEKIRFLAEGEATTFGEDALVITQAAIRAHQQAPEHEREMLGKLLSSRGKPGDKDMQELLSDTAYWLKDAPLTPRQARMLELVRSRPLQREFIRDQLELTDRQFYTQRDIEYAYALGWAIYFLDKKRGFGWTDKFRKLGQDLSEGKHPQELEDQLLTDLMTKIPSEIEALGPISPKPR